MMMELDMLEENEVFITGEKQKLAIFCSARDLGAEIMKQAEVLSSWVEARGNSIITGYASTGLMKAFGDGINERHNHFGITTSWMKDIEPWYDTDPDIVCDDIGTRIQHICDRAHDYLVFPGGNGTMTELFYVLTEKCLGRITGEIIVYNYRGVYDDLVWFLNSQFRNGVIGECGGKIKFVRTFDELLMLLEKAGY